MPKREYLERVFREISSNNFNLLPDNKKRNKLIHYARIFGISVRGNIKTETIKEKVKEKLSNLQKSGDYIDGIIPEYNIYFLDGKYFEDLSKFFQVIFFKEKSKSIWKEEVKDGKTIEDVIREKLEEYATSLESKIDERGISEKLKNFLPKLNKITIRPLFEPKNINIDVKVQLLEEDGKEISIDKKGDGTKRRITMALLEYKKAREEEPALYVFDEPDTHLHVKAQIELLDIIKTF